MRSKLVWLNGSESFLCFSSWQIAEDLEANAKCCGHAELVDKRVGTLGVRKLRLRLTYKNTNAKQRNPNIKLNTKCKTQLINHV